MEINELWKYWGPQFWIAEADNVSERSVVVSSDVHGVEWASLDQIRPIFG